MYQYLREDHSSTPAERDNQETELVFERDTRGKALELFVLLEVCMSPVVLRHVEVELHLLCGIQNQATVLFVPDTWLDMREAAPLSRSTYSAPACLLEEDTELIVTPMIQPFCYTSGLRERAPIVLGVGEGYDTVEAVSED